MQFLVKTLDIFKELRWNQWYKALYVFSALLFVQHRSITEVTLLFAGAVAFSFTSSIVYIINDLSDIERDKRHPLKKFRPLAAGKLIPVEVLGIAAVLAGVVLLIVGLINNVGFAELLLAYLLINLFYTYFVKHVVYADILFVALFSAMRVIAGFIILGTPVVWYFVLAIATLVLFVITAQRLAEITMQTVDTRPVLKKYTPQSLKFLMTFFMMAAVITYFVALALIALPLVYTDVLYFLVLLSVHEYVTYAGNKKSMGDNGASFLLRNKMGQGLAVLFILALIVIGFFVL